MELKKGNEKLEEVNAALNDDKFLQEYKDEFGNYKVSFIPMVLGLFLVFCGNLFYGKKPSILKFRSVEIIARVPYYSWVSASFTLMTLFFTNENKALHYSHVAKFSHFAEENETMHVVVISHLASLEKRAGFIRFSLIPMIFSFFYFWWSYVLYLINPRYSYELNFMFENHAFEQYDLFLKQNEHDLKNKKVESKFLEWYGRYPRTQYEFFQQVRNDEIIHRNMSIHEIKNR
jgi:ubiquinol oxidase